MVGPEADAAADALKNYLPELGSGATWDYVHAKLSLVADAEPHRRGPADPGPPAEYSPALDTDGRFRDYFEHLVTAWTDGLDAAIRGYSCVAEDNSIVAEFVHSQVAAVSGLMTRTLLDALHERRSDGLLSGGTPEERYRSFRTWTNRATGHTALANRYPHAFEHARMRLGLQRDYLVQVITEIDRNHEHITAEIPGLSPGLKVSAIHVGAGDTHNEGRSVARIVFSNGQEVIYKPRPMEAEAGYNAFIRWMNHTLGIELRAIAVVPTLDGGFAEKVEVGDPVSGFHEYFAQIGQLAGVLYLLKATDIHYENMVTSAEGPVVVDAETLLTPDLPASVDEHEVFGKTAVRKLQNSVASIGVLPFVLKSRSQDRGIDVGVIGYEKGQEIPYRTIVVRNAGRDDMFCELTRNESADISANPSIAGVSEVPVRVQRDIIKSQFRLVLEYARDHSSEFASAVDRFLGQAVFRYVNNSTAFYTQLLRMSTHPDAISDHLTRSAVLSRVFLRPGNSHAVADEELQQLNTGDVPYFSYSAGSSGLVVGGETIAEFESTPLDTVRRRISSLSPGEIERELSLIDSSFVNKLPADQEQTGFRAAGAQSARLRPDRDRFLREAVRIGDGLVATMVDDADGDRSVPATWMAPLVAVSEGSQWSPGILGYDIYSGSPGIALVLAGLARETGDDKYRDAAFRVLDGIEERCSRGRMTQVGISVGGMGGMSGALYSVATAKSLLGVGTGLAPGEFAQSLAGEVCDDETLDFVYGLAGALSVCLALHRRASGPDDRERAVKATRDVADALVTRLGESIDVHGRATDYTGYAHGAMGIAPQLIEYGTALDDSTARSLGLKLLDAVFDAYDEQDGDWPRGWREPRRSYAWCHGAPGILWGALTAVKHAPDRVPAAKLARLAELTIERGFGHNPTPCHGDLGNAEIIMEAERAVPGLFGTEAASDLYPRLFTEVVERHEDRFDSKYVYSNSLLVGRAGLAWSILRHLNPDLFPSVLRFD